MKNQLKKIAEPKSIDSIAKEIRKHATAFHKTVRAKSIKLTEFKKFCEICDAEIIVRKSDGSEIEIK